MMKSKTIVLAASLLLLSAVSACAENKRSVAEEPVAEWRVYARDPSFAAGYASGVLVGGVWFWTGCRDFSAGELDAYLRYTADPSMILPWNRSISLIDQTRATSGRSGINSEVRGLAQVRS